MQLCSFDILCGCYIAVLAGLLYLGHLDEHVFILSSCSVIGMDLLRLLMEHVGFFDLPPRRHLRPRDGDEMGGVKDQGTSPRHPSGPRTSAGAPLTSMGSAGAGRPSRGQLMPRAVPFQPAHNENLGRLDDHIVELVMAFVGTQVKSARCSCKRLCGQVQSLRVQKHHFSDFQTTLTVKYPHLKCLDLSFVQHLSIEALTGVFSTCSQIQSLNLTSIATDKLLVAIAQKAKSLRCLDLTGSLDQVSDVGLAAISNCPLEDLNLAQCWNVSNEGLKHVLDKRGPELTRLVLKNNFWVNNETLLMIHVCKKLRTLDLTSGRPMTHLPPLKGRLIHLRDSTAYFVTNDHAVQLPADTEAAAAAVAAITAVAASAETASAVPAITEITG